MYVWSVPKWGGELGTLTDIWFSETFLLDFWFDSVYKAVKCRNVKNTDDISWFPS